MSKRFGSYKGMPELLYFYKEGVTKSTIGRLVAKITLACTHYQPVLGGMMTNSLVL